MTDQDTPTARNQRRLKDAADRLLSGRAEASTGNLDLKALADEAGVPRQYLYRPDYSPIREDFHHRVRLQAAAGKSADPRIAQFERLESKLAEETKKREKYHAAATANAAKLQQAASQIAYLSEQNRLLREQLEQAMSVTQLRPSTTA